MRKIFFIMMIGACSRASDYSVPSFEQQPAPNQSAAVKYEALVKQSSENQNSNLRVALADYPARVFDK